MATLASYLDEQGYVLHITSQLAATYADVGTYSLGTQTASGTPGTVTASGITQAYAVVDVAGEALIEAGLLATGQPVVVDFPFTVEGFETGSPKVIPQGVGGQGASQRIRGKRKSKPEEYAGPKLNKAIESALETPQPEPVIEVAVAAEPDPLPQPETPQPLAPVEVVSEPVVDPEPVAYTPPPETVLKDGKKLAETRAELVETFLARLEARREAVQLIEEPDAPDFDDEQDAMDALNALMSINELEAA